MSADRFTVVAVLDLPPEALIAFRRHEDGVLPLLSRHGGRLERRLRTPDGATEVHLLSFPSDAAWEAYRADPERLAHRPLLAGVPVGTLSICRAGAINAALLAAAIVALSDDTLAARLAGWRAAQTEGVPTTPL